MKFLTDFLPIILFFAAYKLADIYTATIVAIIATAAQIAWLRYKTGRVEPMQWLSLGLITIFGGATVFAQNEDFIKWKPTVLYALMGGALLLGQTIWKKNFIQKLLGNQIQMPDNAWRVLNFSWSGFFILMAFLNIWVAYEFDTDTWVNFKMFGGLGLMIVFIIAQALYMSRFMQEKSDNQK